MESVFIKEVVSLFLILGAIVLIFYFLFSRVFDCEKYENSKKIHTYYISGILVFLIVELSAYICVSNDKSIDIMNYISFASTLSSLILSIIAIIYTIVLSKSGNEQNTKMNEAISQLNHSIIDFQTKTQQLDDITKTLEGVKEISNQTKEMISKYSIRNENKGEISSNETKSNKEENVLENDSQIIKK